MMCQSIIRYLKRLGVFTAAMLAGFVCADSASAQTILKVNSVTQNSPDNVDTAQLLKFAKRVEGKSGGKVKLEIHYGSSLVPMGQAFQALSTGLVDMTWLTGSHYAGQVPEADVYSLPFNFTNHADFARKHVQLGLNAVLDEAFQKQGVKNVSGFPSSAMALITTKKPVDSRAAVTGMKVRSFGPAVSAMIERLGGNPVYISYAELEVALDRGTADGFITGWLSMAGSPGLRRVSKFVTWPPLQGSLGITAAVNLAKYNSLPGDLRKALDDAAIEVVREGETWFTSWEEGGKKVLADAGVKFVDLSATEAAAWQKALEPIWNGYVDNARKKDPASGARAARIIEILKKS